MLRLQKAPHQREELWLGSSGTGYLDLGRMKQAGFAGGLFAIYVPSVGNGPALDFQALMARAPFEVPLPALMTHETAQPVALAMAGHLHWMERAAPDDFAVCRSASAVHAAFNSGRIVAVMHMEGAEAIGPDPRTNDFHIDEALTAAESATTADYLHSGFDQGHQAPAEDFAWDAGEEHDSFSLANMAPQLPGLNRQGWERLEETVRAWAWARGKVQVYVGPIIDPGEPAIGPDAVTVPNGFWKVIVDQARGEAIAFIMPQKPIAKGDLTPFETSIGAVEAAAGVSLPLPTSVDKASVPPLWSSDLKAWRKMHKRACAGTNTDPRIYSYFAVQCRDGMDGSG